MLFPMSTFVAAAMVLASAWIEDPKPKGSDTDAKTEADLASQNATAELAHWRVSRGNDDPAFEKTEKPVLRWSNPQVGRVYGDVHLYLKDGRPEAVVCIYRFFTPYQSLTAECTSLSESPLEAKRDKQSVWSPRMAGLKFQPVPGASTPARDKAGRLQQMRTLARDFAAELTCRYEPKAGKAKDGALFALVVGTDPEAFLVLESRVDKDGKAHWEFAVARMNRDAMNIRHGENRVWEVPAIDGQDNPHAGYLLINLPKP
jgi:hypothetical protein